MPGQLVAKAATHRDQAGRSERARTALYLGGAPWSTARPCTRTAVRFAVVSLQPGVADVPDRVGYVRTLLGARGQRSIRSAARKAAARASELPVRAYASAAVSANLITCSSPWSTARANVSSAGCGPAGGSGRSARAA